MFLKTVIANNKDEFKIISDIKSRAGEAASDIDKRVAEIIDDIRINGLEAVKNYSKNFDGTEPYVIEADDIDKAYTACPNELINSLTIAAQNIRDYHEKMMVKTWEYRRNKGAVLGQVVRGLSKVGIYVPGGTAAYPSSVLMNAIPAKVAGVKTIIMVTPPTENLSTAVLAAAKIAGVDKVIAVGGVQAIAALTFGAGFIDKVDKIVGPGNAYVASAKKQVFGKVDIDMIAGPSEVLIIADSSANPTYLAADLLSQAEHDKLASAVLFTDSMEQASEISSEMERQAKLLPRYEIIKKSVDNYGCCVVFDDLKDACEMSNTVAPEHLEIVTKNPREFLPFIQNAGAVFLGEYSPEPLGDYIAGPSHVLPTSGTARFFSPLSTDTFLKKTSVIEYSREELSKVSNEIINIAESEKLDAHANSIKVRFGK